MDVAWFASIFVTVLVILDPVGNVPIFLSLTRAQPQARARAAVVATAVAASVILTFAVFGERLLELLGISVEALQVAGGLVLVLVALELLGPRADDSQRDAGTGNVALVPLGTPLLAGPGAIAATMVFMRQADGFGDAVTVTVALLAALSVVLVSLRFASVLARFLGDNGIELLSRIVGLILAAIAVQLVAQGIESWVLHGVA